VKRVLITAGITVSMVFAFAAEALARSSWS